MTKVQSRKIRHVIDEEDSRPRIVKPKKTGKVKKRKFSEVSRDFINELFLGVADEAELPDDVDPVEVAIKMDAQENDFDIRKIIRKSVDRITGLPTDMKLPEGDFKEASSFYDFCSGFVSPDTRFPFARQMWIMSQLFGEVCPKCSDPKWYNNVLNVPVDFKTKELPERLTFMKYGKCPCCKTPKSKFVSRQKMKVFSELVLEAGQRSGKSTITSTGSAYLTHKYLKYPRLSSVCEGIQASTTLTATFVGLRLTDAMNLLWEPVTSIIDTSPWFQQYHEMLTDYGAKYGTEFFRLKDIYLKYFHKNLELGPASPSKRALRGRTRFLTAIDELGWFPVDDVQDENENREYASADGTYNALDRSLLTVRQEVHTLFEKGYNNFLPGIAINISSPSSQTDKIHRLVEENQDSPTVLALRLPTWEVNPRFSRHSPVIVKAYSDDAAKAERDYGANPPLNALVFVDTLEARRAFKNENRLDLGQIEKEIDERVRIGAEISVCSPLVPTPPSVLALDAGFSNNAFAFALLHEHQGNRPDKNLPPDQTAAPWSQSQNKLIVDFMVEIQPEKGKTLHYAHIYRKVMKEVIEKFNVRYVFADRWNSLALLHRIEEEYPHVKAQQYSVKYKDFVLARSFLTDGRLILPRLDMDYDQIKQKVENYPHCFAGKPMAHLMFQLMTVRDKGNTVVKGDRYTDDLFRALVLGVARFLDPKILEEMRLCAHKQSRMGQNLGVLATGRSGNLVPQLPQHMTPNAKHNQRMIAISSGQLMHLPQTSGSSSGFPGMIYLPRR